MFFFTLSKPNRTLLASTFAFTICFAVWLLNGVLVVFLVDNDVFGWTNAQLGWLIALPIFSGALFRIPASILAEKYGGKPVFTGVLLFSAIPVFLLSYSIGFWSFAFCSLGFGIAGASFSVGVSSITHWFTKQKQGFVLGVFGVGNAGAAITTILGSILLINLTSEFNTIENWRIMPRIYSGGLVITAMLFFFITENKIPLIKNYTIKKLLNALNAPKVWWFGLYYFLFFGFSVSFVCWLIPYYTVEYSLDLSTAGLMASAFGLPSGILRGYGGWLAEEFGSLKVMRRVLLVSLVLGVILFVPKIDSYTTENNIYAKKSGFVTALEKRSITIGYDKYDFKVKNKQYLNNRDNQFYLLPIEEFWHKPVVNKGDYVSKSQLIAIGNRHTYFQLNLFVFVVCTFILGAAWGIGKAAVYKYISELFPRDVLVVGSLVGVFGALGGFVSSIVFVGLLGFTGVWSSCWLFVVVISLACILWVPKVNEYKLK